MKNRQCEEVGYIDKGFGKHQSNTVYSGGGASPCLCAALGVKYWILLLEKPKKQKVSTGKRL